MVVHLISSLYNVNLTSLCIPFDLILGDIATCYLSDQDYVHNESQAIPICFFFFSLFVSFILTTAESYQLRPLQKTLALTKNEKG
jgi:hypothetical protein